MQKYASTEVLSFSKNKCGTVTEYHKITYKSLSSKVYVKSLATALYWYCAGNIKYELLSKHLFQRKLQYGGWKNFKVTKNLYKKQWLQVIKWNKKHSSNQVLSITCTLEERFFAAATFEGLWVVSFDTE